MIEMWIHTVIILRIRPQTHQLQNAPACLVVNLITQICIIMRISNGFEQEEAADRVAYHTQGFPLAIYYYQFERGWKSGSYWEVGVFTTINVATLNKLNLVLK